MKAMLFRARERFRAHRADYYEYLAALMAHGDGRKTLRDIFEDDAVRYGPRTLRGALSAHWAHRYRESGGDLAQTFAGTLPADDVALLRAAQLAGAQALGSALLDIAGTVRLLDRARRAFAGAMAAAGAATLALFAVLVAVPLYTVPSLQATFQVVPPAYWGVRTQGLFALSDALRSGLPLVVSGLLALAVWVAWSLPNLTGRARTILDARLLWRMYRDFHGIRFLALLSTMVARRGNAGSPLRDALLAQAPGASAWKAWHLNRMLERVDDGLVGADTFRTGMLDVDTGWFLADMVAIHGVDGGLARTRERIEHGLLARVLRRALVLRWTVLLVALAALLAIALWHFAVIDELRRSLQAYYAAP